MDDEFALCWNNFTDNITTGFQNLYDRGDLIDVTLACDGKLLHAHKIVLAICSPYFQEMFLTNPDKHPIIILKDVTFNVMCELLQFMYQGVVNVKQTELSSFMKIAQLLQIKGLTGSGNNNSNNSPKTTNLHPEHEHHHSQAPGLSPLTIPTTGKSSSSNIHNNNNSHINSPDTVATSTVPHNNNSNNNNNNSASVSNNQSETKNSHSSTATTTTQSQQQSHHSHQQQQLSRMHISENSSSSISSIGGIGSMNSSNLKRLNDFPADSLSIYSRKQIKRAASELSEPVHHHNLNSNDSMDQINPDDSFLPPIPQITMGASGGGGCGSNSVNDDTLGNNNSTTGNGSNSNSDQRFNLVNVKREISDHHSSRSISPTGSNNISAIRTQLPHFNFDYNIYAAAAANKNLEYPNDLHMPSDFSKSTANHMDIPAAGSAITMLSSTSLLHGSCIFNRNNTVATQQGMKTYWLCKSYRISMCRARCITHQGRVISATGVHNHPPHMKNNEIINMSLFQFPPSQQPQQQQISTSQITQHQVPGLQQNLQSTATVLSATSLSNSATSLNQTAAGLTLSNTNLNNPNLHVSGGSGNSGILNGNGISNNTNGLSGIINASGLGSNSNLHVQQLPSNFQNSTAAHLSHLNHLTAANNTSNNFNNSSLNMGIPNSSTHQLQQQQQQHTMMQNVLSHQNSLMHLSSLPPSMLGVSNSIHQQSQQLQQEQLSPIHAHQQQPSHHSSLQHLQHQISQLSPSQLTSTSPTLHSQHPSHHNHHHHHHNPHHHHQHHSSHHHNHHNSLGSNVQITSNMDNNDNNNNNSDSPDLNSPHNIRRCDSSSGTHHHSQQIESPSIQQSTTLDSPTNQQHINGDLQSNTENNHHHSSQSIIITNEPLNDNEGSHQNNNDNDNEGDIDNDNCHNGDPDSNQSNMLATITMSPETHPNFKIEDI